MQIHSARLIDDLISVGHLNQFCHVIFTELAAMRKRASKDCDDFMIIHTYILVCMIPGYYTPTYLPTR